MFLSSIISWNILLIGILISILYVIWIQQQSIEIESSTSWNYETLFKLEYEQLSEGIRTRDNMTMVAGTILVATSTLILGACMQLVSENIIDLRMKILLISASLAIYTIWLIPLYATSSKLNNISYRHLEKMEEYEIPEKNGDWNKPKDMKVHRYINEQLKSAKWIHLRRGSWLLFFWVLIAISIVILFI
jgi:hypothetical protein